MEDSENGDSERPTSYRDALNAVIPVAIFMIEIPKFNEHINFTTICGKIQLA